MTLGNSLNPGHCAGVIIGADLTAEDAENAESSWVFHVPIQWGLCTLCEAAPVMAVARRP